MKKKFIIVFIIIFSCKKEHRTSYGFDKNGEVIYEAEYNQKDELLKTISYYERDPRKKYKETIFKEDYDSVTYYYDNSNIFKEGKLNKSGKRFGVWNLFDREGNKREIREWFYINGGTRINRAWFLDKKEDTLAWRYENVVFKQKEFMFDTIGFRGSSYTYFVFNRDTISLKEPIRAYALCGSPILRNNDSQIMVLIGNSKSPFNQDFSNESEVKLDTFYNLTIDKENQKWFEGVDRKYFTAFGYYFKTPGEKTLRGYMLEYAVGDFGNNLDSLTHKVYFEKTIYVKDTI